MTADTTVMAHRCVPPLMTRTAGCDCSRCCAGAPHESDCTSLDDPECTCPATADYHLDNCPEWQAEIARSAARHTNP